MKHLKLYESALYFEDRGLRSLDLLLDYRYHSSITSIFIYDNELTSLNGIEKFQNLTSLSIGGNEISDISMLENLPILEDLYCRDNLITGFSDKLLSKLCILTCYGNPLELPILAKYMQKFYNCKTIEGWEFYGDDRHTRIEKFDNYDWQKWFIQTHPDRLRDLQYTGIHPNLKVEYDNIVSFLGN